MLSIPTLAVGVTLAVARVVGAAVPPDVHLEARSAASTLWRGASAAIPVAARFEASGAAGGGGWLIPLAPLEPGEVYSFEGASFVVEDEVPDAAPCYATPMKISWPVLALVACAACGGTVRDTNRPVTAERYAGEEPGAKDSIDAFHDVLAPLWHAADTPERTENTCKALPKLERLSQDVGDAPLVESVQALAAECLGDRTAFKPKFSSVHDAFHAAMDKAGVKHEEHHAEPDRR
jgi:hypothetical protein